MEQEKRYNDALAKKDAELSGKELEIERLKAELEKADTEKKLAVSEAVQEKDRDLSEKGVEISGGEAQKIALARALYKESPVIVLDEPTAALDPIAEEQVYEGFSNTVGDRTAVYISHRLSSCQFCDEITVFDKGRIVQKGTHAELLENPEGKYRELWDAQAQYYIEQ